MKCTRVSSVLQSSTQFPSKEAMTVELEKCGGVPECQAFRDVTIYAMSGFSFCVPQLVEILANCLWKPQLSEQEVEKSELCVDTVLLYHGCRLNASICPFVPVVFIKEVVKLYVSIQNNDW